MSTVIAIIYHNEICLASDTKSVDHETGFELDPSIKQIVINDEIAIGFSGSGNISEVIMGTLSSPKNTHIISNLTFSEIPTVLNEIYKEHITSTKYPDEEIYNVSALIVGFNDYKPEIIYWTSSDNTETITQSDPNNFTAFVLPPYDISQKSCNKILFGIANSGAHFNSLSELAVNYFKVVASLSEYVSESATIWTHTTLRPDNFS